VETFLTQFIGDDAKFSIPNFMQESGDQAINCSEWKTTDDGVSKSRVIEYTHPVHAPMAPPMARARKEQTYRQYGEHGMVLETKTYVSDVPMTDCFYVADRIRVEPVGANVTITMSFDIRFVKSTMFKSIISRTTRGEFEKFMQRLSSFMAKNLGEEAALTIPKPTPVVLQPIPQPSLASTVAPNLTIALLVCVLLLQMWILLDMRTLKIDRRELQGLFARECPILVGPVL
jgi:hypothetical protein